jgi:hypothetical protein
MVPMKRHLWIVVACLLCHQGLCAVPAEAGSPVSSLKQGGTTNNTPGVEAARALSTLTGVAISPLLGVGAVGAWEYYHAGPELRTRLPWFAQPWFWGTALLLVTLVFLKDVFGTTMPTVLKKPLDLIELFENKLSALVATGAFVPIIASIFHSAGGSSQLSALGLATIDAAPLWNLLIVPVAMIVFVIVFLAGHAINVLILLSPFATVDALLKSFRLFLVSTVMATALINPYVGAVWALALIVISYFIAGWSLRMSVLGTVFAWDMVTFRHRRFKPGPMANRVFTARKIEKVPVRTFGRLSRNEDGRLVLCYRPWLILPQRNLTLPAGDYFVGRGLFYPEIRCRRGEELLTQVTLPPRYRTHEEEITRLFQLAPVQDLGLLRGLKGLARWFKGIFGATQDQCGCSGREASNSLRSAAS